MLFAQSIIFIFSIKQSNILLIFVPLLSNRNFVREDRRRQVSQSPQSSSSSQSPVRDLSDVDELEQQLLEAVQSLENAKGHKITLKKSQADLLQRLQQQQHQKKKTIKSTNATSSLIQRSHNSPNQSPNHINDQTPFLSSNREGVVQSRLIRFAARPNSPTSFTALLDGPETALLSPTVQNGLSNGQSDSHQRQQQQQSQRFPSTSSSATNDTSSEKTVFGISPKSSSLSR